MSIGRAIKVMCDAVLRATGGRAVQTYKPVLLATLEGASDQNPHADDVHTDAYSFILAICQRALYFTKEGGSAEKLHVSKRDSKSGESLW